MKDLETYSWLLSAKAIPFSQNFCKAELFALQPHNIKCKNVPKLLSSVYSLLPKQYALRSLQNKGSGDKFSLVIFSYYIMYEVYLNLLLTQPYLISNINAKLGF